MKPSMTAALVSCLFQLIVVGVTHAISVEPLSPEQTVANAEVIMVGTVADVQTRWSGQGESMIATDYTITLDRIIHDPQALFGARSEGETIVLSFAGGTIGEKRVAIPGIPSYDLGEQAVFFIDGDWIDGISPLVGTVSGDYRVSNKAGLEGMVVDFTGRPVTRSFFSFVDDAPNGFTLEKFIAEVERVLPRAKADQQLILTDLAQIPDDLRHLVFTDDQIPKAEPTARPSVALTGDVVIPLQDSTNPEEVPEPDDTIVVGPGEYDQDNLINLPSDRYAFLWAPPDPTSNFNIPPIYYSGALWGPDFEYSLSDWNRYADLFRKFTTSDNTFGHQGRNDFAFTDWTTFQSVYGFSLPSTVLGIAVLYNSAGDPISEGEKIYESDIILNVDKSWTLDWAVGYANCNIWFFRSTVIHEAGHCFGREHQFTADPSATYNSVMNYAPCGALHTEFWLPLVDDPQSIRAAYPDRINTISDLGVELFRTAGGGNGNGIPVVWSTFNSTVEAGQSFSMNNFVIENLGTTTMTPAIGWWLCPNQQDYTGAYYLMSTSHSDLGPFAYWNTSRTITVPVTVPPGDYYIAGALASDDFDWNRSCWTNTQITVTCPQVATPDELICTPGCGYIDLGWSAATNATSYRIYRNGALYVTVSGTSYRDNSPGTDQLCYQVSGVNSCDESGQSIQSCCTALWAPDQVQSVEASTTDCDSIMIGWQAAAGAVEYQVYRDGYLIASTSETHFADHVDPGCYPYEITGINGCGEGNPSEAVEGCRCEAAFRIDGYLVYYDMVKRIPDVAVDLSIHASATVYSDAAGYYWFDGLAAGSYQVTPYRLSEDGGVSIADVVKIRRHLAFLERFDTPYKYVAADVTCDSSVSVADVVKVRRYLAQLDELPCGNWVFVDSSFAISDANWFAAPHYIEGNLTYDWTDSSFIGVRLGDVNNTWAPEAPGFAAAVAHTSSPKSETVVAVRGRSDVAVGDIVRIPIDVLGAGPLSGVELHLTFPSEMLSFIGASSASLGGFIVNTEGDLVHLIWESLSNPSDASEAVELFTLSFLATSQFVDSCEIEVSGEIVDIYGDPYTVAWKSGSIVLGSATAAGPVDELVPYGYNLSTNFPNPFNPGTHIGFELPRTSYVTLCVYNLSGQLVKCLADGTFGAGVHEVVWDGCSEAGELVSSGVYFYRLEAGEFLQTRKMVLMK
jgi:hypothetical protein